MTVTAESYEANAVAIAVAMLAACDRFRERAERSDASDALGAIVENTSGNPGSSNGRIGTGLAVNGSTIDLDSPFYGIVGLPDGLGSEIGGIAYFDRSFSIAVRLVHRRKLKDETPADGARRVLNDTGTIRSQLEAQAGSSAAFADFDASASGIYLDEEGVHKDHAITEITITVRG